MPKMILGVNLDKIIQEAISETFPSDERQKQAQKAKDLSPFKSSKKSMKKEDVDEAPDSDAPAKIEKKSSPPKVKASTLIDLVNVIRSGQSLKDPATRKDFQTYFNDLNGSEQIALYSFLQAIADITSGVNDNKDIDNEPQPEDYGETMVQKASKAVDKQKNKAKNPSGGSSPIVVGEAANKSKELRLLRGNK